MMDSGTTINLLGNPNMITNRIKLDIPINLLTNAGSKIAEEVGEITGSGQKIPPWDDSKYFESEWNG